MGGVLRCLEQGQQISSYKTLDARKLEHIMTETVNKQLCTIARYLGSHGLMEQEATRLCMKRRAACN